jgi:O-antigen/teichoic acid export membrane protein
MAWPMLVQMLALPLAMQTDRIVLSHRSETAVLAEYNLAWQMFTPIYLVVAAGGMSLWPVFARARARGQTLSSLSMSWVFGAAAAAMALVVGLLSPWLADLASGGAIRIGPSLVVAFCVLTVLQAVKYPLGMSMTDAAGLRFQAYMIVAMLPVNTGLSWWLAGLLGAPGPLVGSIVGVTVFQVLANVLYVRRAGR